MEPVEISAGRLHLRPWTPYDEDAMVALFTDPDVVRTTPAPVPFTRDEARRRLTQEYPEAWEAGRKATFAVLGATTGEVLAWVSLFGIDNGAAEAGWACLPQARGDGVTTEAVQAVCRWGFGALGLEVIEALIAVGNWPSRAVAEKCGFTVDGTRRRAMPQRGHRLDAWTATLLRGEPISDRRTLPAVPTLTDGVVTLRVFRPDDVVDVQRACDDPETARWLSAMPSPYTLEDARAYVELAAPSSWADGREAVFAVTDAATGALLGDCGLKADRRHLGVGEVGYWTAPWARGRGVASRAAALVAWWGLDELGLNRVEVVADVDNVASVRAAERAGFVREGVARRARPDRAGEGRDMVQLSLVRDDDRAG
jgi:RimJ/RimL family protein N-acetyltransferase